MNAASATKQLSQVMKCMVIIFVEDVCMCVCMYVEKIKYMISARDITGVRVASHGKHTRGNRTCEKNWGTKLNKILFPNFFTCSVTPCMVTMTMLPEECWFVSITWLIIDNSLVLILIFVHEEITVAAAISIFFLAVPFYRRNQLNKTIIDCEPGNEYKPSFF